MKIEDSISVIKEIEEKLIALGGIIVNDGKEINSSYPRLWPSPENEVTAYSMGL